jgi:hypothetical protein
MKKSILLLSLVIAFSISCKKKSKSATQNTTVYCMYTQNSPDPKVYRGCATTKEDMQKKAIEMRDAGYFQFSTVEKSSCSECQ